MSDNNNTGNGIGLGTLLFIVFLVLKLTGVITWSWWWVTAPLWIPALIVACFFVLMLMGGLITAIFFERNQLMIKKVSGSGDGCSSRTTYCDGSMHVTDDSFACHHTIDFDDPNDPNTALVIEACDPTTHHDSSECDICVQLANDPDAFTGDICFVGESRQGHESEYSWSDNLKEAIALWKDNGGKDVRLTIKYAWKWQPDTVMVSREKGERVNPQVHLRQSLGNVLQ